MEINENGVRYNYVPDRENHEYDNFWISDGSECAEIGINHIPDLIRTLKKCYEAHKEYTLVADFYQDDDVVYAFAKNMRGCHTYGDNLAHAEEMVKECFSGLLGCYIDSSLEIPWYDFTSPWYDEVGKFIERKVYKIKL